MTIDLTAHVRSGDGIWWGQGAAEPFPLVDALLDQLEAIGPVRAFSGLTLNRRFRAHLPRELALTSYGAMGELRAVSGAGRLDVVTGHYSTLPRLFAERRLPGDIGLIQVSPPGPDGLHSLGIGADYAVAAARYSRILIAEVNRQMPVTCGTPRMSPERFAAVVRTDRPLPAVPHRDPDPVDQAIAAHVASLVDDGDTLQLGVGTLPMAITDALAGHADLGIHSGLIGDGVLRLVEKGVVTGNRKEIDAGVVVAGTAMGSAALYSGIAGAPVKFYGAEYTHAPDVLARLGRLVAVNAALEVDLTGQVGAEVAGDRYLGGVGGQADFSGAAARTGARSVIALRSTAGGASTIVAALGGPVTTARADVDVVVTEHGVAWLRGVPLAERPARLAAIAAPDHRDRLLRFAHGARPG
ncbi:acetyl-CoA hydrolase/transferase C-terminal domain-containing protein [Streptomyces sp. E5N91]|uniref:acetyl-CoA hydrolase/transferase family protein n=1 Tax=Streptomyces sp. E5N91 TaxID=1851996 RepID=UPI000EF5B3E2|nr:acetyl-CoA hydrolase/transferase C-terminal domain-containing protein [Streptomyces sp. E5N91]